jgi:hypothetical protein
VLATGLAAIQTTTHTVIGKGPRRGAVRSDVQEDEAGDEDENGDDPSGGDPGRAGRSIPLPDLKLTTSLGQKQPTSASRSVRRQIDHRNIAFLRSVWDISCSAPSAKPKVNCCFSFHLTGFQRPHGCLTSSAPVTLCAAFSTIETTRWMGHR